MQTDYAQILPIILPAPKAGPSAPANVASSDGKAASPTRAESVDPEATAFGDSSHDPSSTLSAFDQALAQMMMVQVPVQGAKPAPAELAIAISTAAPKDVPSTSAPQVATQNAPAWAANFAQPAPIAVSARSSDAAQTLPVTKNAVGLTAPAVALQVQSKPVDLALSTPQVTKAKPTPDAASVVPSVPVPVQASADRQSQAPILQAMDNAVSDPTARVTGTSVPQPIAAPNLATLTAPKPDQAQSAPSTLVLAQSLAPAQTMAQATTAATNQVLASAQSGVHETAQGNGRATKASPVSGEATSTSTPSISTPLTAVAIATNSGANSADTGGAFQDAPTDLVDTAAAKAAQRDSEASTDIFGAPLPLEGRVTQASPQAGSSATLSTPATAPHLAAEISRKFEGKSAQFDISLTPEGLGKVDVKITINARGEVSAAMKFDNPQAAAELKGRAAELQRALEQSGFSLSQEGISFTDGQGQGFNAPQQQASQQDWQETARRTALSRLFQDTNDLADAAALRVAEASSAYSRRSNTGVDVRI